VDEAEHARVESLVIESARDVGQLRIARSRPIQGIAENRSSRLLGEVNAYLMRTPGFERASDQRGAGQRLDDLDVCDRPLSRAPRSRREALAIGRVPPVEGLYRRSASRAHDDRDVFANDVVATEELFQSCLRPFVFRDDEKPARALVEAMNDPWTELVLARLGVRVLEHIERQETVYEGAARVPFGGVYDHSSGLVHDEQVLVLIDDAHLDARVGTSPKRWRRRKRNLQPGSRTNAERRVPHDAPIDAGETFVDGTLNRSSRDFLSRVPHHVEQAFVEPVHREPVGHHAGEGTAGRPGALGRCRLG
jgi:hypothetical protein